MTPLLLAAEQGFVEMVKLLLDAGGDNDLKVECSSENSYVKLTPLLIAAGNGCEDVVVHTLSEYR